MALPDDFKNALSSWASGVAVVVAMEGERMYGLTVSSFTSISLDPPLVAVCIGHQNRLTSMVLADRRFSVTLLAADQQAASNYFAKAGREPTEVFTGGIDGDWSDCGLPLIAGGAASVCCELHASPELGDHTLLVGRVIEARSSQRRPLLYWNRGYRSVAD